MILSVTIGIPIPNLCQATEWYGKLLEECVESLASNGTTGRACFVGHGIFF